MSTEQNKLLVRRQFDEIWNKGNWATVEELYAPGYVNHDPYNPDQGTGPEGFKQRVSGYRAVLHDFDLRVEHQIAEGDMVETHWSLRGTHAGELEGTAPTGRSVYVDGQLLSRIVDGKFVEEWVHWDTLGLLRQIGAVPPPRSLPRGGAGQALGHAGSRLTRNRRRSSERAGDRAPGHRGAPADTHGRAVSRRNWPEWVRDRGPELFTCGPRSGGAEIEFDFIGHELAIRTTDGTIRRMALAVGAWGAAGKEPERWRRLVKRIMDFVSA